MSDDRLDRDIEALEARILLLDEDVSRFGKRADMFEFDGDKTAAAETRGVAALYRARIAGYSERARRLRAEREPVTSPLPMMITRRVG